MNYSFSGRSLDKLGELDERLQEVLLAAIRLKDFTILEGFRNEQRQNALFNAGKSKLQWPDSKHNFSPALAVDIAPYPIDWANLAEFRYLAGLCVGIAHEKGIELRWGGDWDRDGALSNNRFNDLPHLEIVL